jgi:branched-chain amino acid transport system permease protein
MGINTRRVEALSFAAASALAGMAGFLIVPLTGAEPHLGTGLGIKAFAIAIIAGLAAPRGILIFGLLYGAFEGLVSGYLYTGVRDIVGFSLMIVALYLRPQGIFGHREEERV